MSLLITRPGEQKRKPGYRGITALKVTWKPALESARSQVLMPAQPVVRVDLRSSYTLSRHSLPRLEEGTMGNSHTIGVPNCFTAEELGPRGAGPAIKRMHWSELCSPEAPLATSACVHTQTILNTEQGYFLLF